MRQLYVQYAGTGPSIDNVLWTVEILRMADQPFESVGVLDFDLDPLVIEWPVESKEVAVLGSMATLKIISPGDRTYQDLYTVKPGEIALRVRRNGELYWVGALDPELYEEPYERSSDYVVTLTFSDLGMLGRVPFGGTGILSLNEILTYAASAAGLGELTKDTSYISTCFADGTPMTLDGIAVRGDNFYDEDGKPMSYKAVLTGILQPLGLRMIQRAGKLWIYDLNGLAMSETVHPVRWCSTSQMLSADKVYNNITITFSPYVDGKIIDCSLEYDAILPDNNGDKMMVYYDEERTEQMEGFLVQIGHQSGLPFTLSPAAGVFRIDAKFSGSDEAGIAYNAIKATLGDSHLNFHTPHVDNPKYLWSGNNGFGLFDAMPTFDPSGATMTPHDCLRPSSRTAMMVAKGGYISYMGDTQASYFPGAGKSRYKLKVLLRALLDVKYNPFESEAGKHQDWVDWTKKHASKVYVPVRLILRDKSGVALYHYENWRYMHASTVSAEAQVTAGGSTGKCGAWASGEGRWGDMWLAYYDSSNVIDSTGIGGWVANKPMISPRYMGATPKRWSKLGDGEFIDAPPAAGWLELQLGVGAQAFGVFALGAATYNLSSKLMWAMYKEPSIEIVDYNGKSMTDSDIEYSGILNAAAQEDLPLDTVCGSAAGRMPTARGVYVRKSTGETIVEMKRGGVTDRPEQLLIGTMYSQYADRHTVLTGEADLDNMTLCPLSEANQEGKIFMTTGEVQHLFVDATELTISELRPDEYEKR